MNQLARNPQREGALVTAEQAEAIRTALKTSLYPGASDGSVDMVLAYCQAGGLDPMTKPVHIVPMWIPEKKEGNRVVRPGQMQDVIMPGIELYRTKAHRTSEYAGQDEAEFGPTVTEKLGGVDVRYPEWCKVTVYRITAAGVRPYSAKAYWLESYATAKRDSDAPNAMWKKRPFGQLEKCAEALALRKAFPEAVGAQPTAEEMEGKSLVIEGQAVPAPAPAPARAEPAQLPHYSDAEFAEKLPAWRQIIADGKKTPDALIAVLQTKARFTEDQLQQIRQPAAKPAPNPDFPLADEEQQAEG